MTQNELVQKVKEILAQQLMTSLEEVKEEANLVEDLAADSLDIVEIVMKFEEEFAINIPDEEVEKIRTVRDVIGYLEEKVLEKKA